MYDAEGITKLAEKVIKSTFFYLLYEKFITNLKQYFKFFNYFKCNLSKIYFFLILKKIGIIYSF